MISLAVLVGCLLGSVAAALVMRASPIAPAISSPLGTAVPLPTAISTSPVIENAPTSTDATCCVSTETSALAVKPSATAGSAEESPLAGAAVAFVSTRDGDSYVFVADGDGKNIVRIDTPGPAYNPAWSPDGTRLAFTALAGQLDVFVTDGVTMINLTQNPADDSSPAWSPDGTRIAFQSNRDGDFDLYLLDVSTNQIEQITVETTQGKVFDGFPAWSPDGTRIAFSSNVADQFDVYLLDLSTGATTALTDDAGSNLFPAWSPDGKQIAFQSDRSGIEQVMVVNADGSGERQITEGANKAGHPAWLPDGRLMYESGVAADLDLFIFGQSLPFIGLSGSLEYDASWK